MVNSQLIGDVLHLAAIVMLPIKLQWSGDASGVSLKTQELYLLVFLTRYMDLCLQFVSMYNSSMKIIFIAYTGMTLVMLRCQPSLRASYDNSVDFFRHWMHAVVPSLGLALVIYAWNFGTPTSGNSFFFVRTFSWTFSELLEPLAIVPQLLVLRQCTHAGKTTWCYVSLMATYRAFYILEWASTANEYRWYVYHVLHCTALTQALIFVVFLLDHVTRTPALPDDEKFDAMGSSGFARERLLRRGSSRVVCPPALATIDEEVPLPYV